MIIQKITTGFVIQEFDTDAQQWINQDFIAEDGCDYEIDGEPVNVQDFIDRVTEKREPYLQFDMVQPDFKEET